MSLHQCVCLCDRVCVSVCVQNTSFCQSAGRVIKSLLVTALVWSNFSFAIAFILDQSTIHMYDKS